MVLFKEDVLGPTRVLVWDECPSDLRAILTVSYMGVSRVPLDDIIMCRLCFRWKQDKLGKVWVLGPWYCLDAEKRETMQWHVQSVW